MFGSIFDKVTGLFDRSFVLGLLLPTFACCAGIGAVVATRLGWRLASCREPGAVQPGTAAGSVQFGRDQRAKMAMCNGCS